jgi:hypothetical protein
MLAGKKKGISMLAGKYDIDGAGSMDSFSKFAHDILEKSRVIERCGKCAHIIGVNSPESAYKCFNTLVSKKDPSVAMFTTRREGTDAIQRAHTEINYFDELCVCDSPYNPSK